MSAKITQGTQRKYKKSIAKFTKEKYRKGYAKEIFGNTKKILAFWGLFVVLMSA
jgi:hypothetical protein